MPRKNDQDFLKSMLVVLEEALVFNEKAIAKVRTGQPLQNLISELNGNALYINNAIDRVKIRMRQKTHNLV